MPTEIHTNYSSNKSLNIQKKKKLTPQHLNQLFINQTDSIYIDIYIIIY